MSVEATVWRESDQVDIVAEEEVLQDLEPAAAQAELPELAEVEERGVSVGIVAEEWVATDLPVPMVMVLLTTEAEEAEDRNTTERPIFLEEPVLCHDMETAELPPWLAETQQPIREMVEKDLVQQVWLPETAVPESSLSATLLRN